MMAGELAVGEVNGHGNGNGHTSHLPPEVDPQTLINHLSRLLQVTLGATEEELQHSDSLLGPSRINETLKGCSRFAQETKAASLYIQKLRQSPSNDAQADSSGTS